MVFSVRFFWNECTFGVDSFQILYWPSQDKLYFWQDVKILISHIGKISFKSTFIWSITLSLRSHVTLSRVAQKEIERALVCVSICCIHEGERENVWSDDFDRKYDRGYRQGLRSDQLPLCSFVWNSLCFLQIRTRDKVK